MCMKIMVTGGTGFVGSHTTAELIRNGHIVRLLVRSKEKIKPAFQPFGMENIDYVEGDVLNRKSIEEAAKECDATIHCGSVYSLDPRTATTIRNTNVNGTQNVLSVAQNLGHDPIVHVSSFVALIGEKHAVLTPSLNPSEPPGAYFRSKAESDQVAREFQQNGAPVVITYPGSVWGPYDPHLGESFQIAYNALKGYWRISVKGILPISDVRDIAKLHTALMQKGHGSRRYMCTAQNVTIKDIFLIMSELTNRHLKTSPLPGWSLLLPMRGLDSVQKMFSFRFPYNFQSVYCASRENVVDDSATRKDFNIEPKPLAETLADQISWMAKNRHISPEMAGNLSN